MPRTDGRVSVDELGTAEAQTGSTADPTARSRPEYSRTRINAAGATLIDPESSLNDLRHARAIVNNWRGAHSLPLDRIWMEQQERVAPLGEETLVAQRLKRLSSIDAKLRRFRNMNLARMQDVGGCRAVLPSVNDVRRVAHSYADRPPERRVIHTNDYRTTLRRGCLHRPFKTTSASHSNRSQHRPRAGSPPTLQAHFRMGLDSR